MKSCNKRLCAAVLSLCLIFSSFSLCFAAQNSNSNQQESSFDMAQRIDDVIRDSKPTYNPSSLLKDSYMQSIIPLISVLLLFLLTDLLIIKDIRTFLRTHWLKYLIIIIILLLYPLVIYLRTVLIFNGLRG
jgi:hypothetical protein